MAYKTITAYGSFTAQNIKDKADIPAQTYMTISGSDVRCENINIGYVSSIIDTAINTVSEASLSNFQNKWANFNGIEWYIDVNKYLQTRYKTPYKLSYFAGYNHNAVEAKVLTNYSTLSSFTTPTSNTFTITISLNSGEINWPNIVDGTNITKVVMKVYDYLGQLADTKSINISTFMKDGDQIPCIISNTITSSYTSTRNYYVLLYFGSTAEELIAYYPGVIGTSPVVHHHVVEVKYLDYVTFSNNIDYTTFPSFPTMQLVDISGNLSYADVATDTVYIRTDIKLIPPFQDCGGNGNFPRFNNSPLTYNADIKLVKEDLTEYWFYNVISGNNTCVNYADTGDNTNPPYQRIWFDYTLSQNIFYGDHIFVYIKRINTDFQYGYCNGGTPVYVP